MNRKLYRILIKAVPPARLTWTAWTDAQPDEALRERLMKVLRRERVQGGALALLTADGRITASAFGRVRRAEPLPARPEHFFRAASISKFVTAAGVLRLAADGRISLDRDIGEYLGFAVRHPKAPERPITLRQLLGHRAGIRDGASYMAALSHPLPLPELMSRADVYTELPPDEAFEYSNLGAGIVGAVLEAALKEPLDDLMRDTVFVPAGVDASYLPQRISGVLADAWRVMPPERHAGYDAAERQARPLPAMDPNMDYLTAHGGLCVTAEGLLRIAKWTLRDPAFSAMRIPLSAFEKRDPHLREGLGCFIYDDPALGFSLYGHQGLAYGAVNGLFFRMDVSEGITGFALLTSAASEQREGVITALNRDVARAVFHP